MQIMVGVIIGIGGAFIAVVSIIVTIVMTKKYRPRKELSTYLLRFESTLEVTEFVQKKVEIKYDKKPVKSLERVRLFIQNSGNKAITNEDIKKGELLRVRFSFPAQIIDIRKVFSSTKKYRVRQLSQRVLEIRFNLLNPGDCIALELLTTEADSDKIFIEGKGVELIVKNIEKLFPLGGNNLLRYFIWGAGGGVIFAFVMVFGGNKLLYFLVERIENAFLGGLAIAGIMLVLAGLIVIPLILLCEWLAERKARKRRKLERHFEENAQS